MNDRSGLLSKVLKASLKTVGGLLARAMASLMALVVAAGLAVIGLALMMVGVIVFQQTLSRVIGLDLKLSDALRLIGRTLTAVSTLSALGSSS